MERRFAIGQLANLMLDELSAEERDEQLSVMLLENWEETQGWDKLPNDVINEFEGDDLMYSPSNSRYDEVLKIWIIDSLMPASNQFLKKELVNRGIKTIEIKGNPLELEPCPCCGRRTLQERAYYCICTVCWWEDDGQDNENASESYGGPNYGISLTLARYNYLTKGIYDPSREDLEKLRAPSDKYEVGRIFKLVDGCKIFEPAIGMEWDVSQCLTKGSK